MDVIPTSLVEVQNHSTHQSWTYSVTSGQNTTKDFTIPNSVKDGKKHYLIITSPVHYEPGFGYVRPISGNSVLMF